MTLLEKINNLTWYDLINKLKDILKGLNDKPSGGDSRPYKVYTALLTQTGTNAPVATVLENTLGGEVVWSRTNPGEYVATLAGRFTENRTYITVNCPDNGYVAQMIRTNEDEVSLSITPALDTITQDYPFVIEIRVYS